MASSVFPGLMRAAGARVTLATTPAGEEICRHDPHLSAIQVQTATDLKRPLPEVVAGLARAFDDVIVLNGSVEHHLLPKPEHTSFYWSDDQRRRVFGRSYLAATHELAGVPPPFRVRFYPTPDEAAWAEAKIAEIGRPLVLVALKGSHQHKVYPRLAQVVCQLLAQTDVAVVLSGDASALELEAQVLDAALAFYGRVDRIYSLVNTGSIRRVCALAQRAAVVIGPETGVLNAVSLEPAVAKVVFLSHSSRENLTGDWVNTVSLLPTSACYPCHRLHRDTSYCPQDEVTGAAACAASIPAASVVDAVQAALRGAA